MSARLFAVVVVLSALVGGGVATAAEESPAPAGAGYGVQPGDILEVSVWREEGLQKELAVRPDGGFSFPLAGEITAQGRTAEEIRKEVADKLAKFIPDPVVSVAVQKVEGNRVYVIGKVNRPGEFTVNRYVDVLQALSMAGGLNPFAAVNDIKILRRNNGQETAIPFRYADIERGRDLEQNVLLQAGDVVVVP